jgi:hypothetical protein
LMHAGIIKRPDQILIRCIDQRRRAGPADSALTADIYHITGSSSPPT